MEPVVCVVARNREDAPPVVEALLRELTAKGLKLATIVEEKRDFATEGLSETTARYQTAGCDAVIMRGPRSVASVRRLTDELPLDALVWEMRDEYDVILADGFRHASYPKIEIRRPDEELLCHKNELLAVIGERPEEIDIPSFAASNLAPLADLIRRRFMTSEVSEDAALFIDGVRLPLHLFVRKMVASTILGMVRALKGVEDPKSVVVAVKRRPPDETQYGASTRSHVRPD
ncbi:MAG: molybdopterin-guanine dinucleotide biosynthesis protein MobB [Dehalococcoidia bacterium]|nr:molybdopterin-guanine dinucleotide biosynthesis protein MobB [Dehalococcoidia bacterium]